VKCPPGQGNNRPYCFGKLASPNGCTPLRRRLIKI